MSWHNHKNAVYQNIWKLFLALNPDWRKPTFKKSDFQAKEVRCLSSETIELPSLN